MHDDANIIERPDPRIACTERKLRILERMTERGMEIIDAVADRACAEAKAPPESPKGRDPIEAYARISRTMRFNMVLDTRLADYLAALVAGGPDVEFWPLRARQNRRPGAPPEDDLGEMGPRELARANVLEIVDPDSYDEDECERIYEELDERLYEYERYDEFLDLPMQDLVELICKDLGVKPNWERWQGENWPAWRKTKPAPPPAGGDQTPDPLAPDPLVADPLIALGALAHPPPGAPAIIPHDPYPDSG
jgi:hypothetical protein